MKDKTKAMKVKIFGKRKNDRLNESQDRLIELQKRIEKLIPEDGDKLLIPAGIMKEYSERVYMLCGLGYLKDDDTYNEKSRSVIMKYCATCLFGMSIIASGLGVTLDDIIKDLEIEVKIAEEK
ncbi:hypothetical protein [Porphyromonas endodontalis]